MTDASSMSSMSSMSGVESASEMSQSTSGAAGADQGSGSKTAVIAVAVCLLLTGCAFAVALTVLRLGGDSGDDIIGAGDDGVPPSDDQYQASNAQSSSATTPETTSTSTSTSTTTTTHKPEKLACSIFNDSLSRDDLCDYLFLEDPKPLNDASPARNEFAKKCRSYSRTKCGMLTKGSLSTALQLLRSPNGKKATEELWKSGVRHQIVLYVSLSGGAQLNEIDTIVALRKEFDSQQEKLKSQPGDYAYYFVGVLAQYSGNAASDSLVKTHFQRMLLEAKPNGVVFVNFYEEVLESASDCQLTGPNIWNKRINRVQGTFIDNLRLLTEVNIPATTLQMFSISPAKRVTEFVTPPTQAEKAQATTLDFAKPCKSSKYVGRGDICYKRSNDVVVDNERLTCILWKNDTLYTFDDDFTISNKVCKVNQAGFYGGWFVFDTGFEATSGDCAGAGTYPITAQMRKYARTPPC